MLLHVPRRLERLGGEVRGPVLKAARTESFCTETTSPPRAITACAAREKNSPASFSTTEGSRTSDMRVKLRSSA
jgi:hypothetical protein